MQSKFWWLSFISIVLICVGRWMPHPPNFTPLVGASLFAGALWSHRIHAFVAPLLGLWISDLFLNNVVYASYYSGFVLFSEHFIYTSIALVLIVGVGSILLKKQGVLQIGGFAILSSLLFFAISNFGVWLSSPSLSGMGAAGLGTAYTAGLPFLWNGLLGDMVYTGIFFGAYHLYQNFQFRSETEIQN